MEKQNPKCKKQSFRICKDLRELNDDELDNREIQIRKEIDATVTKPITIPPADLAQFEKEEMIKKRPHVKNT